jgi:hypothetical protein
MDMGGPPAGGVAAAAPEGCARRPVGNYFYFHAVGDGNHVAVPSMAWEGRGLKEVPAAAIRVINNCHEAMYGGFWKT